MSLKIIHKYSTAAGTPPASGDIDLGEIAINAADAELYTKDSAGSIKEFRNSDQVTAEITAATTFTQAGTGAVQRTVESKLQDVVSVKDFGAVGDGVADDTAAIKAALAASSGKTLYFPSGIYNINTSGTVFTFNNPISVQGEGRSLAHLRITSQTSSFFNAFDVRSPDVSFSDIKLELIPTDGQSLALFILGTADRFVLCNCDIYSNNTSGYNSPDQYAISVRSDAVINDLIIKSCIIHNWHTVVLNTNTSLAAINGWSVLDSVFFDNYGDHMSLNHPLGSCKNVLIQGNKFGNLHKPTTVALAVALASVSNAKITDNTFDLTVISEAIHIEENCKNVVVAGNSISVGALVDGTSLGSGSGITLLENDVAGSTTWPTNVVISNNTISRKGQKGGEGIRLTYNAAFFPASENVVITGNTITGFARGVELDVEASSYNLTDNVFSSCTDGLYSAQVLSPLVHNNVFNNCTTAINGRGLLGPQTYANNTTELSTPAAGKLVASGFSVTKQDISIAAGDYTDIDLINAGQLWNGNFNLALITNGVQDYLTMQISSSYDGTTVTSNIVLDVSPGGLSFTNFNVTSGRLRLRVFCAAARTAKLTLTFTGTYIV